MTLLSFSNRNQLRPAPFAFVRTPRATPSKAFSFEAETLEDARMLLSEAQRLIHSQEDRIRQLENQAMTDDLTGLMNRRALMGALRRELAGVRRNPKETGLLVLIDIDDFKQINDSFGHPMGDAYLQTAASVLLNEVRSSDYVARLGGDEFAVILPHLKGKEASARLERLERAFNNRVMHARENAIPLKGSFGFAVISEAETPESLMIAADTSLYAAKARRKTV